MQQQMQGKLRYKETTKVMRKAAKKWRDDEIAAHPYCYISGSTELLEVHHAGMSFSEIFRQAHTNLSLEYHKYIFDYTREESAALRDEIIRLHNECEAVVLTHDIHLELHQMYGSEVNMEKIEQFKKNFN